MMRFKLVLYSGLLLVAASFSACREKRFNNLKKNHCPASASILPAADSAVIMFPNAFSPNGDGKNDIWKPLFNEHIVALEMSVVDLKGKVVFASSGLHDGWGPTNDSKKGMTQYVARVKATSTSGNVMDACMNIYTYYCTPKKTPVDNSELIFIDQIDLSRPGNYVPTMEQLAACD